MNVACLLGACGGLRGAPIHIVQQVTLDDAWSARRLRARFSAFSRRLRVTSRSLLLPPATARDAIWTFEDAGHVLLLGKGSRRGPVVVHMRFVGMPGTACVCPTPLMPDDEYDLHVQVDASLAAAYFGERGVRLGEITGIRGLDGITADVAPMTCDDVCRTTIVPGAGLPIRGDLNDRGDLYVFSRLRLPTIPRHVLERHEPLLRSLFSRLGSLSDNRA